MALPDLDVAAPPFDRNPSAWSQRIPIVLIATTGFIAAAWMALYQWHQVDFVWDPLFGSGTRTVLTSKTSRTLETWFHMPDAALGAVGYLSEIIFGMIGSTRRWQYRPWMVIIFGFDVIPLGFVSVALVLAQGLVVHAWCFLCLYTALISLLLMFLAYDEVWATLKFLLRVWRRYHDRRLLWQTFWGEGSHQAEAVALERD